MKMAHRYNEQFNLTHRDRNMLRFLEKKIKYTLNFWIEGLLHLRVG